MRTTRRKQAADQALDDSELNPSREQALNDAADPKYLVDATGATLPAGSPLNLSGCFLTIQRSPLLTYSKA